LNTSQSRYWSNITITTKTLIKGLKTTLRHVFKATSSRTPTGIANKDYFEHKDGLATLQYPHESFAVPDNGRYRLHNEMDDCIVCDKCVKICPVDCIEIDAIRAVEEIGKTSDGTPKRIHGAKFDIDMSKCCFCGLCTTVCPTESLTMTKTYDFSEYDVRDHNYAFATMTPLEIIEKKQALEQHNIAKAAGQPATSSAAKGSAKPKLKPRMQQISKDKSEEGPAK
jgi:NADH-quinone oxidoreductase subunit I